MGTIGAMRSLRCGWRGAPALASTLLAASLWAGAPAIAQTPAAPPAADAAPAPAPAAPAAPAPSPPAAAVPPPAAPAPGAPGAVMPPHAEPAPPVVGGPAQTVFTGEGVVMAAVPVAVKSGSSSWDEGFDSIVAALNIIQGEMAKLGLTQAGEVFVVYTQADDAGFEFEAQIPFSGATTAKPGNEVKLASSFTGKALKFVHKGSFADMDDTYEQIANYLDARSVTALDFYIEQYRTDPRTTPPDKLLLDILVPVR